jgi:hypothetical protein
VSEFLFAFGIFAFGLWLAVHCFRSSREAHRSGKIRTYPFGAIASRGSPTFWTNLAASYFASVIGAMFTLYGGAFLGLLIWNAL